MTDKRGLIGSIMSLLQSWISAGVIVCFCLLAVLYLAEGSIADESLFTVTWPAIILFTGLSAALNRLYETRGYPQTQRHWMKSPKRLSGRVGYVLTGSITLCAILGLGLLLAFFVVVGLFSLGQAAWSS